jgi:pimeloyl-ACP methyl ester carboxylesterase
LRWETAFAPGRGVRLHVRRVTDPAAPPVLLLHGLGVSGSVFQPFARYLLPELAAVVPDLRGHGLSDAPPSGYTPADYATDLVELIEQCELAPVPIIGNSLGALVGLSLAEVQPELVRWLVLLDPPLDPERRNPDIEPVYRLRHAAPGELERFLGNAAFLAPQFRQASDAPFEAMLSAPAIRVPRLNTPVLLIQADPERDGVLGDDAAAAAVQTLGNARLVKIPHASHAVHGSHPSQVADAIRQFYSSEAGSSR